MKFEKEKFVNYLVTLFFLFYLVYRLTLCFSYKEELTIGESNNIWNAIKCTRNMSLYTNPEQLPFEIFQYTPLSQLPIILFAKIYDPSIETYVHNITTSGRLLELIINLITFYILYKLTRLIPNCTKLQGVLSSMLGFILLTPTAFSIRPDSLALLFISIILYIFYKGYLSNNNKLQRLAYCLGALSFFAKQDTFYILFPIGIFLLINKKWISFLINNLIFGVTILILLGIFQLIFGQYFIISILKGIKNPISIAQCISVFDRSFSFYGLHFILGNVLALFFLLKSKNEWYKLISITVICYEFFALATTLKIGSWANYYTPFVIFSSFIIMEWLLNNLKGQKTVVTSITLLLCSIYLFRQVYNYTLPYLKLETSKKEYHIEIQNLNKIKTILNIKKNDKIVIPESLGRNLLATNSVMVNSEYYEVSPFDYSVNFTNKEKVSHILFRKDKELIIKQLTTKFYINLAMYQRIESLPGDYIAYTIQSSK